MTGRLGVTGTLALALLAVTAILDACYVRVTTEQTILGYFVIAPIGVLALATLARRQPLPLPSTLPVWLWLTIAYTVVAALAAGRALNLIGYDTLSLLLPALWLLAATARPELVGPRGIGFLLAAYTVAAVLAPVVVPAPLRHDAPSVLLIAAAWLWFARRPGWLPAGALAALLYLTFLSGYRTQFVLWAVLGYLAVRGGHRWLRHTLAFVAVAGAALTGLGLIPIDTADVVPSRYSTVTDLSTMQRVDEVRDALTAMGHWPAWEYLTGAGPGGAFPAQFAWYSLNVRGGQLVHIHVGPMLVLFHLGVIGLVALVAVYVGVVRRAWSLTGDPMRDFFRLAMLGMLLDFLVREVTLVPEFGLVVGGYLFYEYVRPGYDEAPRPAVRLSGAVVGRF